MQFGKIGRLAALADDNERRFTFKGLYGFDNIVIAQFCCDVADAGFEDDGARLIEQQATALMRELGILLIHLGKFRQKRRAGPKTDAA